MTPGHPSSGRPVLSRRQLLAGSGVATAGLVAAAAGTAGVAAAATSGGGGSDTVPFDGPHQAGIATPEPARLVFAAFDVTTADRAGLVDLLATWSAAAARMAGGRALTGPSGAQAPPPDSGEALDLPPSRLTVTVGFGPSLFDDRFGLADRRPAALVDLPAFPGDALDPRRSHGDLCLQVCADDALVAFHAVRNLTRLALGAATVRYVQVGFGRTASPANGGESPRNLLGFKDGTDNLDPADEAALRTYVWVDERSDQPWMAGGSYLVARRIRIHLDTWDRTTLGHQERTVGRHKVSGAPLGGRREHDPVNLAALDASGTPVIPVDAHIRVASPATNHGQAILRRGYSFADGVDPASGELDAGLFFVCFQKDPRRQFVPIQEHLADQDALAAYLVHTGSGIFACPPGTGPGRTWATGLR